MSSSEAFLCKAQKEVMGAAEPGDTATNGGESGGGGSGCGVGEGGEGGEGGDGCLSIVVPHFSWRGSRRARSLRARSSYRALTATTMASPPFSPLFVRPLSARHNLHGPRTAAARRPVASHGHGRHVHEPRPIVGA